MRSTTARHLCFLLVAALLLWQPPMAAAAATKTPTATPTDTSTRSKSVSPTATTTPSETDSDTRTRSSTPTNTISSTRTKSISPTETLSGTGTRSATPSRTATATRTRSATLTPSQTLTTSRTSTPTRTRSATATPTYTATRSTTRTRSPSISPTITGTRTPIPTVTPTSTETSTRSRSPTRSPTPTPSPTMTPTSTTTLSKTHTRRCHIVELTLPTRQTVSVGTTLPVWVSFLPTPEPWCPDMPRSVRWDCQTQLGTCDIPNRKFPLYNITSFTIPASSLFVGTFYTFNVTVTLDNGEVSTGTFSVLTEALPLVAYIVDGDRTVTTSNDVVLNGTMSYDPSPPLGATYSVAWSACRLLSDFRTCDSSRTGQAIFDVASKASSTNSLALTLPPSLLLSMAGNAWRFQLTSSETSTQRSAIAYVRLNVTIGLQGVTQLSILTPNTVPINDDSAVYLTARLADPAGNVVAPDGFSFLWSSSDINLFSSSVFQGGSAYSPAIAFKPYALYQLPNYTLTVQVFTAAGTRVNVATAFLPMNHGPRQSGCTVCPSPFTVVRKDSISLPPTLNPLDQLDVTVSPAPFTDTDAPLSYRLALAYDDGTSGEYAISGSSFASPVWTSLEPAPTSPVTVTLPQISAQRAVARIVLYVRDSRGCVTPFTGRDFVLIPVAQPTSAVPTLTNYLASAVASPSDLAGFAAYLATFPAGYQYGNTTNLNITSPIDVAAGLILQQLNASFTSAVSSDNTKQLWAANILSDATANRAINESGAAIVLAIAQRIVSASGAIQRPVAQGLLDALTVTMVQHSSLDAVNIVQQIATEYASTLVLVQSDAVGSPASCDATSSDPDACLTRILIQRKLPSGFSQNGSTGVQLDKWISTANASAIGIQLITISHAYNPYAFASAYAPNLDNATVQVVTLWQVNVDRSASQLNVNNLYPENRISVPVYTTGGNTTTPADGWGSCAYWDDYSQSWSTTGLQDVQGDGPMLWCVSSHLTSFTIVSAGSGNTYYSKGKRKIGLIVLGGFIAVIAIAGCCLICILLLLLWCCCKRRKGATQKKTKEIPKSTLVVNPLENMDHETDRGDDPALKGWLTVVAENPVEPVQQQAGTMITVRDEWAGPEDRWLATMPSPQRAALPPSQPHSVLQSPRYNNLDSPARQAVIQSEPVNTADLMEIARAKLEMALPRLGVQLQASSDTSIKVLSVQPGGPMELAGVQPGDVILEFDGEPVHTVAGFQRHVQLLAPGDECRLTVMRDGQPYSVVTRMGASVSEAQYRLLQRVAQGHIQPGDEVYVRYALPGQSVVYAW
eukprot:TRINITY_DN4910_c0_g1_i1.p1 TRINITY_DN4910_c0_g1~~TRINITY_DN4910_c0_g1_i1.p1  ORF type:complete len:1301 (+),score=148.40 TRINITY_DN4910_c0_g1_i1:104-4006(+)